VNPLTGLYGAASTLRNSLFDCGVLSSRRLEQPVVSVGNLSVGGSGKTPFVIALGELLKARGIRFDVLSRGYGRKTRGALVVESDGKASDFGDEPLLIARRLGVPVIVGESRYKAGRVAERKFQSQLHILDDGFQHRSLARDFDIVLLTERDLRDRLLPSGRMREPLSSLARADAVVLPSSLAVESPMPEQQLLWRVEREILLTNPPSRPVVFCGIARPEQFFKQVCCAGITPAAEVIFRDHHAYGLHDIQDLIRASRDSQADGFLTTEKDAINLGDIQQLGTNRQALEPLAVARLRVTIDDPTDVVDAILTRISDRKPRS
jgi:tetraacyldisaccharide 4'-kinase